MNIQGTQSIIKLQTRIENPHMTTELLVQRAPDEVMRVSIWIMPFMAELDKLKLFGRCLDFLDSHLPNER